MSISGGNAVMAAQVDVLAPDEAMPVAAAPDGIEGLIQPVRPGPLRLPLMERLVDRWPGVASERLAKAWGISLDLARGPMRATLASEFVDSLDANAIVAQFDAPNGPNSGFLAIERPAVFMMVDAVLGGAGKPPPEAAMHRPLTLIELSLMQPVATHLMTALTGCLEPAGKLVLRFRAWGQGANGPVSAPAGGVLVLPLTLGWRGREARLSLALSLAALEPMLPHLGGVYPGAALGGDGVWRSHLAREIGRARTRLTAVLAEAEMPLARVRALAVGETLMFDVPSDPVVSLRAGPLSLASGRLGRANGRVAVRLDTPVAVTTGGMR